MGSTAEPEGGFDVTPTDAALESLLAMAQPVGGLPAVAQGEVAMQTACCRPESADELPLIGPVPGWPGVVLATGHGGEGLCWAPGTGLAVAELLACGESTLVDLSAFDPGRFEAGPGAVWRSTGRWC